MEMDEDPKGTLIHGIVKVAKFLNYSSLVKLFLLID